MSGALTGSIITLAGERLLVVDERLIRSYDSKGVVLEYTAVTVREMDKNSAVGICSEPYPAQVLPTSMLAETPTAVIAAKRTPRPRAGENGVTGRRDARFMGGRACG
jgi:hypothetical protein